MIWFRTRHEVKQARADIAELREMLRAHFDIKYTMQDFTKWYDGHPNSQAIPTSVGEFLHFYDMLDPAVKAMYFRGTNIKPLSQEALNDKADREFRDSLHEQ